MTLASCAPGKAGSESPGQPDDGDASGETTTPEPTTGSGGATAASTGPGTTCGDGVLDPDEPCDDGNSVADDGCRPDCSLVVEAFDRTFVGVMPRTVAVAPGGDLVVGGTRTKPAIRPWLARLAVNGASKWEQTPADPAIGSSVLALGVAADGTIHAAGGTTYDDVAGEAWLAHLTAEGAALDADAFTIGDYTRAQGLAPGPASSWYVGGEAGTYSAWVRRIDGAGEPLWTWTQPDASAYALAVDPLGDAFAAGVVYGAAGAVWRIDPDGATRWTRPQPTPWLELAVDAVGALYVAGSQQDGAQLRLWIAKLDADGDEVWRRDYAAIDEGEGSDGAGGLVVSPGGAVFCATQVLGQGSRVDAFAAADGAPIWAASELLWRWEAIAVLPTGDPVVAGWDIAGPDATGVVRVYDAP
ncbi:MAG: hypothetical protein JNL82_38035 [Myxococcales bacterium]|nr:hypothetical protein [Myxococcales bacterium]